MDVDDWAGIALLLLGLVLLGFVSIANAVFSSIGQPHPRLVVEKGKTQSSPLCRILRRPSLTASALLIAGGGAFVAAIIGSVVTAAHFFPFTWQTVVVTAILILIATVSVEVVFKVVATSDLEKTARLTGRAIELLVETLMPAAILSQALADALVRRRSSADVLAEAAETPERPILLVSEPAGQTIEEEERKMIQGIFALEQTPVSQIMVPRIEIAAIEAKTPLSEAIDYVIERGFSRVPVYENTMDDVIGVIHAKDLLGIVRSGKLDSGLQEIAHAANFVPEYKKVGELLKEFRQKKVQLAIVVDEYGGTQGLVSIEDLLEQIVGEIEDEYDSGEREVEVVGDNEAVVDARVGIDELNELFTLKVESDGFDTVGGLLLSRLGRIPSVGDSIQTDGATFSVLSVAGKRAKQVRVVRNQK